MGYVRKMRVQRMLSRRARSSAISSSVRSSMRGVTAGPLPWLRCHYGALGGPMKFRRTHWARIALLGIAFVTFRAAEAQMANETVIVMTPAPQYAVPPPQSALEFNRSGSRCRSSSFLRRRRCQSRSPSSSPRELDSYPPDLIARARRVTALPPVEYDKPYEGRLMVTRAESQDGVRELCSRAVFRGHALGCARRLEEGVCDRTIFESCTHASRPSRAMWESVRGKTVICVVPRRCRTISNLGGVAATIPICLAYVELPAATGRRPYE